MTIVTKFIVIMVIGIGIILLYFYISERREKQALNSTTAANFSAESKSLGSDFYTTTQRRIYNLELQIGALEIQLKLIDEHFKKILSREKLD